MGGALTAEQKETISRTLSANEHLIALVRDLLDVSRIEEGKFGYEFARGDLSKLINNIYEELKPQATAHQIKFIYKKPELSLPSVVFDAGKLDIAIRNVLDNAIKYTPSGGCIKINLHSSVSKKYMILSIEDNGIGIPEKDQKFIFVKFFRASNAVKYETEGSGLGLYIAKKITEKHNADLFFESKEDRGSEFVFQFPLDEAQMPKAIVTQAIKNHG